MSSTTTQTPTGTSRNKDPFDGCTSWTISSDDLYSYMDYKTALALSSPKKKPLTFIQWVKEIHNVELTKKEDKGSLFEKALNKSVLGSS